VGDSNTDRQAAEAAGVAFRWADLFFGRPIDRGYQRPDGHWVQLRQVDQQDWSALSGLATAWAASLPQPDAAVRQENLALVAQTRAAPVGWLSLMQGESAGEADLAFGTDPAYRESTGEDGEDRGIGALLFECALDWARAQPGLERLCVSVLADNLPVSRLCCRYGFEERRSRLGQGGGEGAPNEWIQLDCSL
jgi:ribosomal protein S18 acetylase RimI-like enzyme